MNLNGAIKYFGYVEIVVGVIILSLGTWVLVETVLYPDANRFGVFTALGLFGGSMGALLAFPGVVCATGYRFKVLAHLPLAIHGGVLVLVFHP